MIKEFRNYSIEKGKVVISLEKNIYIKDMIDGAKQDLSNECNLTLADKKDRYEIILTPRAKDTDLENLAIMFNDSLIGNFSLYTTL